jgi:hypothetical protein
MHVSLGEVCHILMCMIFMTWLRSTATQRFIFPTFNHRIQYQQCNRLCSGEQRNSRRICVHLDYTQYSMNTTENKISQYLLLTIDTSYHLSFLSFHPIHPSIWFFLQTLSLYQHRDSLSFPMNEACLTRQ